ncbi:MAG: GtrA family protein [Actinobacteria bacterium]|nr:GtrA family protein [Actinomycetota bacterium]
MSTTLRSDPGLLALDDRRARAATAQVEVVIPVYNEEAGLDASIRRLHDFLRDRFPLVWLITIVDNASTDRTWGIACRLANELDGVQAMRLDHKGRGRALRAAWTASEAPVVAYMDVDLSTDLDALLPLVAPLLSGHSDVAIGSRLAPGARVVRGPKREAISRCYNLILKATLRCGFSDAQCGFKAIRTEVARELLPKVEDQGWFFDTELLVLAEHNGLRIHEVPVDWVDDPDSRVNVVGTAKDDLHGVWRMLRATLSGRASIESARSLRDDRGYTDEAASQLVRFASIGVVSTIVFAFLFALLVGTLGPFAADVVALAICTVANTAANRRLTFQTRGRAGRTRHYLASLALAALPLALTLGVLVALAAMAVGSLPVMLVALTGANLVAALGRFTLLRRWVFGSAGNGGGDDPSAPEDAIARSRAEREQPRTTARREALRIRARQLVRYGAVSVISTTVSLIVLGSLVQLDTMPAAWANAVATAAGTVPSFELNRRWVWNKRGRRSVLAEIGPFCILSFAGLGLSTFTVALTAQWALAVGLDSTWRTIAVELANLTAFGSLWVAQFLVLDRVLFGRRARAAQQAVDSVAPPPDLLEAA